MIRARDVWFYGGGLAMKRYGRPTRTVRIPRLNGEEFAESFARNSIATYQDRTGRLQRAAANVLRAGHCLDLDADGVFETPSWLIEPAATNLVENGSYETDAVGTGATACTAARDSAQSRLGAWSLKITTTNVASSGPYFTKRDTTRIAAVAATVYTVSLWYFAPAASVGKTHLLAFEWYNAGLVFLSADQTAVVLAAGWNRASFTATAPANTAFATPTFYTNGLQGIYDVYVDGVQLETGSFATSVIETNTGTVTRSADFLSFQWNIAPKACSIYTRFIEAGLILTAGYTRVMQLGSGSAGSQRWLNIRAQGDGFLHYAMSHETNGGAPFVNSATPNNSGPAIGTLTELKGDLFADGSVQLGQALNGGALVQAARSGGNSFVPISAPAWASPILGNMPGPLALLALIIVGSNGPVPTVDDFRALL